MRRRGKVIPFPGTRPAPPKPPALDERSLVEVHRCDHQEALVVKSLFESEGIAVLLRSPIAHSVHPFTVGAQGEARILVAAPDAERSRLLLARISSSGPGFP